MALFGVFVVVQFGEEPEAVPVDLDFRGDSYDAVGDGAQRGGSPPVLEQGAFADDRAGAERLIAGNSPVASWRDLACAAPAISTTMAGACGDSLRGVKTRSRSAEAAAWNAGRQAWRPVRVPVIPGAMPALCRGESAIAPAWRVTLSQSPPLPEWPAPCAEAVRTACRPRED